MHKATLRVCGPRRLVGAVAESLEAEAMQPAAPSKGSVEVSREGECIMIVVGSESLSGLRALVNSYLYLLHAAWSALEAAGELAAGA
ncbi:MAG: hypothetical protein LRS49_04080 [Desulfurococcales archaeon]|nr:hypothetical protein [Desulfurococcales archaeon]